MKLQELRKIIRKEVQSLISEIYDFESVEKLADFHKLNKTDKLIAYNESYWQWEYDASTNHAFLYLSENGDLRLVIINEYTKSGIGAGTTYTKKADEQVGTINKPQLLKIRTLLKKYSHKKTKIGYPFKRLWENPIKNYEQEDLNSILEGYKNE